jgi:uncharacterized SAM-binding protein YcdF (DUF218 family)
MNQYRNNDGHEEDGTRRSRAHGFLRVLAVLALLCAAFLLVFAVGFAAFATHVARLQAPQSASQADAIIVLTGGEKRLDAALDLLKAGKGKRLLISGVHPSARTSDLQRATGSEKSLFSCCVDLDHAALDTIGNAEESAKWVREHKWKSVIVVTNNYHMPRSLLELRREMGDVELLPYPVVNTRLDGGGWMTNQNALRVLFPEYVKYLAAFIRGNLPESAAIRAYLARLGFGHSQ